MGGRQAGQYRRRLSHRHHLLQTTGYRLSSTVMAAQAAHRITPSPPGGPKKPTSAMGHRGGRGLCQLRRRCQSLSGSHRQGEYPPAQSCSASSRSQGPLRYPIPNRRHQAGPFPPGHRCRLPRKYPPSERQTGNHSSPGSTRQRTSQQDPPRGTTSC